MRKWLGRVTGNRTQTQTTAYLAELDGRLQTGGLLRLPPLALLQNRLRDGGQLARGLSGGGGCWLGLTVVVVVVVVVGERKDVRQATFTPSRRTPLAPGPLRHSIITGPSDQGRVVGGKGALVVTYVAGMLTREEQAQEKERDRQDAAVQEQQQQRQWR